MKRFFLALECLIFLLGFLPICVNAEETTADEPEVVKVAYLISPAFQEGGEGEYKSGQGYEYLQKIASYTGWTYEYVYGDFGELLSMLASGEVDLMGDLSYTEERAEYFLYGDYEQGKESFYVYVKGDSSDIRANDYSTLNGKKIGVSKGSYQETLWDAWCDKNNVQCEVVEFTSIDERQNALNNGEIDASLGSLMPNDNSATKDWKSVFSFGDAPYYFGVNKQKPELLEQLNRAQAQILNENPYYNEELNMRYLPNGILSRRQLDEDEVQWIQAHEDTLIVGFISSYMPLSSEDDNGVLHGVMVDLMDEIGSDYAEEYNLSFEYKPYESFEDMMEDLKEGKIDIAGPVMEDYWIADQEGVILSNRFLSSSMVLLRNGNEEKDLKTIGVISQWPIESSYASIYFPESEQVVYSSSIDVAKALKYGKVDAVLLSESAYHVLNLATDYMGEFTGSSLPQEVGFSFAVAKNNPQLMSLLNRGISNVGDTMIYNFVATNSYVSRKIKFTDWIADNPGIAIFVFLGLITVLMVIIIKLHQSNRRARIDAMTGLLNKVAMHEHVSHCLKQGGTLIMTDIDDFKNVNDKLGHTSGDDVIASFAESLKKIFSNGDFIGRFGGDEFLVFIPGLLLSDQELAKIVNGMEKAIGSCEVFCKNNQICKASVSVGILRIEKNNSISYTEAFRKVDAALYKAKKNAKGSYVIEG